MGNLTEYSKGQLISHMLRTATSTKPTQIWIALFYANDTEVSGGGYARVQHGPGDAYWRDQSAGNGITSNIGAITFPEPTGSWGGDVAKWAAIDNAGNVWLAGSLAATKSVTLGDPAPTFPDGALVGTFA